MFKDEYDLVVRKLNRKIDKKHDQLAALQQELVQHYRDRIFKCKGCSIESHLHQMFYLVPLGMKPCLVCPSCGTRHVTKSKEANDFYQQLHDMDITPQEIFKIVLGEFNGKSYQSIEEYDEVSGRYKVIDTPMDTYDGVDLTTGSKIDI